jgi:hypothetical protein
LKELFSELKKLNLAYTDEWLLARYNPPTIFSFLSKNELWVRLE